ncbi:MAG TPA: BACON domain-containing protein, partial [Bacteroidales bacterium]|nr:BACON domain-containing protein [Bacteroidales bacterium]
MKNISFKRLLGGLARLIFLISFLFQYPGFSPSSLAQTLIGPGTTFKVALGTTLMSAENLVIKNGALLGNSGTLALKKGLTNEYTVPNSLGAGLVEFSGTTNQTILGQNILQDMKVANPAGITIGGNTTVNGVLNFLNGRIVLGAYHLNMGPSASVTGNLSATAMVVATGTGELRKEFSAGFTGSFTWPVGDATNTAEYSPVTLTFSGGSFTTGNYVGVKLANSPWPGMTVNYLKRYWTLTQSGIASLQFSGMFQYLTTDVVGNESSLSCLRVDPPPTVTYSPANTNLHQLNATGVTATGAFTGGQTAITCTLSVTPANQNVPASPAGATSFTVTSNCDWSASSSQTWCTVTPSGSGNGTIAANYTVNTLPVPRTATITVTV